MAEARTISDRAGTKKEDWFQALITRDHKGEMTMAVKNEQKNDQKAPVPVTQKQTGQSTNTATEIDLEALFFRFLEKIHWILLTALLSP